jgi:hypothetical protein
MKQRKKRPDMKITVKDFINAVKKADREIEQTFRPGWSASNKIHKSKKAYNRKENKRMEE